MPQLRSYKFSCTLPLRMALSPRVYIPVAAALILSALIGGLFLWQIHSSVSTIESSFDIKDGTSGLLKKILPGKNSLPVDSVSQSQALMELRQGEIFELKGEWKQAQDHYEKSVLSGGGVPALRKLASIQLQRREYDAAAQTIARLKEANRDSEDVALLEGLLALRKGDADGALAIFKRRGDTPQAHYGLGLVAITKNDHETAKKELTSAAQGHDAVIREYAKTILAAYDQFALFPSGQEIHLQTLVARALAQANECETALPILTAVVALQDHYRDAWIVKGYCEFTSERLPEALTSLEHAYALDPEKAEIQYFLARTYAALGDPQNAVTFLQYALINGFSPEKDARLLLAEYALELGQTELALEQYKIIAEKKDSDLASYQRYVDLAVGSTNHSLDAFTVAKEALARWPDDPSALTLAAKAALAAGLPEEAEKYITSALRIDPKNPQAQQVLDAIKKAGVKK